ncbi:MAG: exo-alpha-sialidase [Bacteroidetes bacterium]|nr:MAG: exo-alpha-sialidase [Bacteroidota bacterium]
MIHKIFLSISFLLVSLLAHAQWRTGFINDSLKSPNELSIAVNPINSNNWVVGANINQLYITFDAGMTWQEMEQQSSLGPYGDPVLHADSNGYFYHAHLSKTPDKPRPDYLDRMIVQRSTDGGKTWNDGVGVGFNRGKVQDKEWLSMDEFPGSKYRGSLYMSWTEFDVYGSENPEHRSRIRFAASRDTGLHFLEPVVVSDGTGDCQDGDNTLEGATTAVGPNGDVYICWAGNGKIYFDKSEDGGKSFGKDQVIGQQAAGWTYPVPGIYRSNAMPFIQCNPQSGDLYVVYTDSIPGRHQLNLLFSQDGGKTWKKRGIAQSGGPHIFFPNMQIHPGTGDLSICYYQNTEAQDSITIKVIQLSAKDLAAESWPIEAREIGPRFPVPGAKLFFGDYIDIAAYKEGFVVVWTSFEDWQLRARYAVLE